MSSLNFEYQGQRELAQRLVRRLTGKEVDRARTLGDGIVQRGLDAIVGALVDQRGVVGVIDVGVTLGECASII